MFILFASDVPDSVFREKDITLFGSEFSFSLSLDLRSFWCAFDFDGCSLNVVCRPEHFITIFWMLQSPKRWKPSPSLILRRVRSASSASKKVTFSRCTLKYPATGGKVPKTAVTVSSPTNISYSASGWHSDIFSNRNFIQKVERFRTFVSGTKIVNVWKWGNYRLRVAARAAARRIQSASEHRVPARLPDASDRLKSVKRVAVSSQNPTIWKRKSVWEVLILTQFRRFRRPGNAAHGQFCKWGPSSLRGKLLTIVCVNLVLRNVSAACWGQRWPWWGPRRSHARLQCRTVWPSPVPSCRLQQQQHLLLSHRLVSSVPMELLR